MSTSYSRTISDGYTTELTWNTRLTTVRVTHNLTGLHATGNAKLHPDDEFDLRVGAMLATTRAQSRLFAKISKKVAKYPKRYSLLLSR